MKLIRIISNVFHRLLKPDKKVLGRWQIESCIKKQNSKVDLSNEDHCGPCGQYIILKSEKLSDIKSIDKILKSEKISDIKSIDKI